MGAAQDLVHEFDAAFDARRLDDLTRIMTADVELISPRGTAHGHREVQQLLESAFAVFPDLAVEPVTSLEDSGCAAVQQRFAAGALAACELVVVDTWDGLISSWRTYYDQLPVLVAAGVAPPQPGGDVDHARYPGPTGDPAPGADPVRLGQRLLELLDAGATDFDEIFTPDTVFVHPSGPVTGGAGLAALQAPFRAAFPDARHAITRTIAAGAAAVFEGDWAGTHTAPLRTPQGEVATTGIRVNAPFASLVRVAGTHIASVHLHTDQVGVAAQLGLMPTAA